jgi:outer membrane protein assembly factor BamC
MSTAFLIRTASFSAALYLLTACGSFDKLTERGKVNYKTTASVKPLDIPPDLTAVVADDRFVVPDVGSKGTASASSLSNLQAAQPSGMGGPVVLQQALDVKTERAGSQRWLVVNRTPEQVWPVVREFWLQSGFVLKVDRPDIGILETDWAENRAKIPMDGVRRIVGKVFDGLYSSEELDRYRTRLERTEKGTEVYVSHRGLVEVYADASKTQTVWQPRPTDPEMEVEFLNRLILKLAGETPPPVAKADARPVDGKPAPDSKARVVQAAAGDKRLQVAEPFDRTWRRVGLALDRTGFTVEDRDRSKGLYFVQFREESRTESPKTDKPGFFSRFFGGKSADTVEEQRLTGRYRIRVAPAEGRSEVTVSNSEGAAITAAVSDRILNMLESELR